jgi:hypothetical protein
LSFNCRIHANITSREISQPVGRGLHDFTVNI